MGHTRTKTKSAVQSLAVAVISGGVLMVTRGETVAGALAVLAGVVAAWGYQHLHDADLRRTANDAAESVTPEQVLDAVETAAEGAEDLAGHRAGASDSGDDDAAGDPA